MAQRYELGRAQDILARWCAIAEQRLDHLTELYESGRWRRYHSEISFMENFREAEAAVETWHALARREATLDNAAVDFSWLGRSAVPLSQRPLPERIEEPPARELALPVGEDFTVDLRIGAAAMNDERASEYAYALESAPDARSVQERYPVLHNSL
jgi:hypothetical protein